MYWPPTCAGSWQNRVFYSLVVIPEQGNSGDIEVGSVAAERDAGRMETQGGHHAAR